jgi:hypothetical protein
MMSSTPPAARTIPATTVRSTLHLGCGSCAAANQTPAITHEQEPDFG